jgi:hypothetical protein
LRLEREPDGVAVAEEAVDDGEPDEGDSAGDADGARRGAPRRALGVDADPRGAPPVLDQQRGAQLVHLGLQALRAPQDAHAGC